VIEITEFLTRLLSKIRHRVKNDTRLIYIKFDNGTLIKVNKVVSNEIYYSYFSRNYIEKWNPKINHTSGYSVSTVSEPLNQSSHRSLPLSQLDSICIHVSKVYFQ